MCNRHLRILFYMKLMESGNKSCLCFDLITNFFSFFLSAITTCWFIISSLWCEMNMHFPIREGVGGRGRALGMETNKLICSVIFLLRWEDLFSNALLFSDGIGDGEMYVLHLSTAKLRVFLVTMLNKYRIAVFPIKWFFFSGYAIDRFCYQRSGTW